MTTATDHKLTPATPFYAAVGMSDHALELVRRYAAEVQAKVDAGELAPKALGETAREQYQEQSGRLAAGLKEAQTRLEARVTELQADARSMPKTVEATVSGLQADAKTLSGRLEARIGELQSELKALPRRLETALADLQSEWRHVPERLEARLTELAEDWNEAVSGRVDTYADTYAEYAARGEGVIASLRGDTGTPAGPTAKQAAHKTSTGTRSAARKTTAKKAPAPRRTTKRS